MTGGRPAYLFIVHPPESLSSHSRPENRRAAPGPVRHWRARGIGSARGMSGQGDKHRSVARSGLLGVLLAVAALLATAGTALAGQDDLKGGSVLMQLQG